MNVQLYDLMQKEMSRKEFLATAGFGVASIFGMGTLLRLLGHNPPHVLRNTANSLNYGGGAYGGRND